MRILLDENLPEGLIDPLRRHGHREVASGYDLFFTKDREFASQVNTLSGPAPARVILTVIPQQPEDQFVAAFVDAFGRTDWSTIGPVHEWPSS